jgi:hypothetical protein
MGTEDQGWVAHFLIRAWPASRSPSTATAGRCATSSMSPTRSRPMSLPGGGSKRQRPGVQPRRRPRQRRQPAASARTYRDTARSRGPPAVRGLAARRPALLRLRRQRRSAALQLGRTARRGAKASPDCCPGCARRRRPRQPPSRWRRRCLEGLDDGDRHAPCPDDRRHGRRRLDLRLDLAEGFAEHGVRVTLAVLGPAPDAAQRAQAAAIPGWPLVETDLDLDWTAPTPGALAAADGLRAWCATATPTSCTSTAPRWRRSGFDRPVVSVATPASRPGGAA